jgi:type IV secretory pathway TraG/TraD family ATPase VirD4
MNEFEIAKREWAAQQMREIMDDAIEKEKQKGRKLAIKDWYTIRINPMGDFFDITLNPFAYYKGNPMILPYRFRSLGEWRNHFRCWRGDIYNSISGWIFNTNIVLIITFIFTPSPLTFIALCSAGCFTVCILRWQIYGTLIKICFTINEKREEYERTFKHSRNAGIYGDAGWAYAHEIKATGLLQTSEEHDAESGIFLGCYLEPYGILRTGNIWHGMFTDQVLIYSGNSNCITNAPPRGGKNATEIIPTLLLNNESCFVFDVKGENFFVTHLNRLNRGHKIIKINPFNMFGEELGFDEPFTDCYNPLQNLKPDSPNFVSEIDSITSAIIFEDSGRNSHFDNRARDLVSCLIAHVCSDEVELENGLNNLPRVREILGFNDELFIDYMGAAATSSIPIIRNNAATFIGKVGNEIQSVKATAATQLRFLNEPNIARFLSRSDFQFEDMRTQAVTVYCMIPSTDLEKYNRFARLMIQSMITALSRKLPAPSDRRILVILDELAQLRKMDIIEKAGALLNGYKVRIWSIFQSQSQAEDLYSTGWKTFYNNAESQQYIQPNEDGLNEALSKRIGDETVQADKLSENQSKSVTKNTESSTTTIVDGTGKTISKEIFKLPFLTPQDIAGMPKDRKIIFIRGLRYPVMAFAMRYYEERKICAEYLHCYKDEDLKALLFFGHEYAPHPTEDAGAYEWMRQRYAGQ